MLGLQLPTDPRWVNLAEMDLEEILTDHAYCEQKAATSCISLIQMYPEREELVESLSPIVTEEWGHFRQVLAEIRDDVRSGAFPDADHSYTLKPEEAEKLKKALASR